MKYSKKYDVYVAVLFEGNNPLGNVFVIGGGND